MPTYCFIGRFCRQYNEVREYPGSAQDPPLAILDLADGYYGVRDWAAEHGGARGPGAAWPLLCEASGVHPSQVDEARRRSEAAGVPTDFDRHGRAILTSRQHRAKYLRSIGAFDRAAGYSDPAP